MPEEGSSVAIVDHRKDVRDFLVSRRARVSPEQASLPPTADIAECRVCGARRLRCSPA
jgi:hypothetical protein